METVWIAFRTFATTIVAALLFGWVILRVRTLDPKFRVLLPRWTEMPGVVFTVLGATLVLLCFGIFAVRGRGTPSPLDPPKEFVALGPYRYVRNPIHIGQVTLFIGLGLLSFAKTLNSVIVTMLQAAPHAIHFKRILNFREGQSAS